jgi:hypothetical protein
MYAIVFLHRDLFCIFLDPFHNLAWMPASISSGYIDSESGLRTGRDLEKFGQDKITEFLSKAHI